jgi:serine/threonine protein kinase
MHPLADTGRVIAGRYRLDTPIGRGAMGVVWRARDQLLDRDVAVKEVHMAETLSDEERANAYQRTLREAKTAARLNHPGVVTVYDVAEDEGRPWIVMQLVNAQSLDQVLADSGPLSPRQAAEMGRQLLAALTVAHAAGVMHRDVKPSNVLLSSDGRAVLTDFGIATFQGDPKLTQTGMVMGSPGFTAPERIRGEDASPASDLWSLGATIYAAVEGQGPFEKRGGAITTMSAIINEDAPEPGRAGALAPVIVALLRREPSDRPDATRAQAMITEVLPLLADRGPGSPGDYEPTAISVPAQPRVPTPGNTPNVADAGGRPTGRDPNPSGTAGPAGYGATGHVPGGQAGSGSRTGEAPPDFSSWYDPSPRTGSSTARTPWTDADQQSTGRAYPPPAGYGGYGAQPGGQGQQGGYGSQQASGSPPWSGAQPGNGPAPRRRSGLMWKITIVVLAIIGAGAGAAAVILLHQNQDHSSASAGQSATPSAPTATGSPAQIVDAINQQATGPAPAGYTPFSVPAGANEQSGFHLAAPSTWKASTSGYQTYFKDPNASDTNLLVDLTPHTYPSDMLKEATYIRNQSIPKFPGYHQLGLARLTIRGQPGAYWKFTWDDNGVQQEVLDLLYAAPTSGGNQSFALYMTAPASAWNQTRPVFDDELRTFAPG